MTMNTTFIKNLSVKRERETERDRERYYGRKDHENNNPMRTDF